jgi:hypothetical protein
MKRPPPSAEVLEAAALAQLGMSRPEIAVRQGCTDRAVRRRLVAARAAGLATEPPDAAPPRDAPARAATAPPAPKGGRVPVIGITGGGGHPAMIVRPGIKGDETPEQFRERTGGAGRGSLGKDYSPGDLERDALGNPIGRVLVASTTIHDSGERRRAIDLYSDQALLDEIAAHAPEGARFAVDAVTGAVYEIEEATA